MKRSHARGTKSSITVLFPFDRNSYPPDVLFAAVLRGDGRPLGPRSRLPKPRASHAFEQARKEGPLTLRAFLFDMPKGADLHNHLSGAVYAESWIRAAGEDGLCVNETKLSFEKAAATTNSMPPQPVCGEGNTSASLASKNRHSTTRSSMPFRCEASFHQPAPQHTITSSTRFRISAGRRIAHFGEWLDEVASRAALQNEQYLELMETPDFSHTIAIAKQLGWHSDLAKLRTDLLAKGLRDDVNVASEVMHQALDRRNELEKCGTPNAAPACRVEIRFLYQVLRGFPPERVYAQTVLAFEVASAFPEVVGLNFVMPEDGYLSMKDYRLQMQMLDYLHSVYPKVHIALHAGELAAGPRPSRWTHVPYSLGRRAGTCGAHWPWSGPHLRGASVSIFSNRWQPTRAG